MTTRVDDRFLIVNDDVAGFRRFAHQVEDGLILLDLEIEVHLHSTLVGVGGHRVPHAAAFQLRQPHRKLTGVENLGVDVLVDRPLVGVGGGSGGNVLRLGEDDVLGGERLVGGVELM